MLKSTLREANSVALRSFLNSLLRDFDKEGHFSFLPSVGGEGLDLAIKTKDCDFFIPLMRRSVVGHHSYGHEFFMAKKGEAAKDRRPLAFSDFLLGILKGLFSCDESSNIYKRVLASRDTLKNILDHRSERGEAISDEKTSLFKGWLKSEQDLLFGHPFHPFPKLKEGMGLKEQKKYTPEMEEVSFSIGFWWRKNLFLKRPR